ncbi:hypothetical protein N7528_005335 [Penicillium herquei]|nr:hypothetical protein N7528_005335 [Penicillium herquei]
MDFEEYLQTDWSTRTQIVNTVIAYFRDDYPVSIEKEFRLTSLDETMPWCVGWNYYSEQSSTMSSSSTESSYYPSRHDPKKRILGNIQACREKITPNDLKRFILSRSRFRLEQAAAIVVSAMVTAGRMDYARRLIREMDGILTTSFLWTPSYQVTETYIAKTMALHTLCRKLPRWFERVGMQIEKPESLADLVKVLLRVRRCEPMDRCLYIPLWMFEESGTEPPEHLQKFLDAQDHQGISWEFPSYPPREDVIILSKKSFRVLQTRIFELFRFWKPECRLQREASNLEREALFPMEWIEQNVLSTDNIVHLCQCFFHSQRQAQKKVLSTVHWWALVRRWEGKDLYQNDTKLQSTFERVLADIAAEQTTFDTKIIKETEFLETPERVATLVEQTCLLMRDYVNIYGAGDKKNLIVTSIEQKGARGPTNQYNLLCNILFDLKMKAWDLGIDDLPGQVHQFLRSDIMESHDNWEDDAFATGRIPGWELWLADREVGKG